MKPSELLFSSQHKFVRPHPQCHNLFRVHGFDPARISTFFDQCLHATQFCLPAQSAHFDKEPHWRNRRANSTKLRCVKCPSTEIRKVKRPRTHTLVIGQATSFG